MQSQYFNDLRRFETLPACFLGFSESPCSPQRERRERDRICQFYLPLPLLQHLSPICHNQFCTNRRNLTGYRNMDKPATNVQSCFIYVAPVFEFTVDLVQPTIQILGERDYLTEAYKYFSERLVPVLTHMKRFLTLPFLCLSDPF